MTITQNSTLNTQNRANCADWHCHILPNLDDGAKDLSESLAIAAILAEAGFSEIHCTPHSISGAYEASPVRVRQATLELQEALDKAGVPLRVFAGSEYYCDEFLPSRLHDPLPLGSTNMILMEAPLQTTPHLLSSIAYQVALRGFTPLIAHPERCALLQPAEKSESAKQSILGSVLRFANARLTTKNSKLKTQNSEFSQQTLPEILTSMGCRFQGNLGSFAGIYGERVRKAAIKNLQNGLYDCLGSDAHASRGLASWLQRGLREVESHVGADGLAALLAGPVTLPSSDRHKIVASR
jgi:protein-tyrosine phosphatase